MKKLKKVLALVLVFCMVMGSIPATAFAATETEVDADLTAALDKAKTFTNALTINNSSNDPETVVKNFKTHFTWDNEKRESSKSYLFDWSYYNGVVFEGLEYLYEVTGEEVYKDYVVEYMSSLITSNGTWAKCSNNSSKECAGYNSTHGADCYKTASLLLDAYKMTNDSRYLTMAETLYADLDTAAANSTYSLKNAGKNFRHTWASDPSPDLWLDGLYMILPFRAEYAKHIGDTEELDLIVDRMQWVSDNMYNSEKGLFYHAADNATSNSGSYWLRAIGWYAAALVDVMDSMEGENLEAMKKQLVKLVDGMKACQNTTNGMWLNNMAASKSSTNPYETSGTALTCYAVIKAVNNGWLDESYADMATLAFKGICNEKMSSDYKTLTDICFKGAPGSGNSTFYDNEGKGVGPFIMFYAEMQKYVNNLKVETPEEPETPVVPEVTVEDTTIKVENVTNLVGSKVDDADKKIIENREYENFVAFDITATIEDEKSAVVSIPVPSEWNATEDKLVGISVEDGVLKEIRGTLSDDGIYSFEVNHFSAKGIALLADINDNGVNYNVGDKVSTLEVDGAYYLIQNNSQKGFLTSIAGHTNNSKLELVKNTNDTPAVTSNNLWYIKRDGNGYTVQFGGPNGQYLAISNGGASVSNDKVVLGMSYENNNYWDLSSGNQHLNHFNGDSNFAAGWQSGAANDTGSCWNLYKVTMTSKAIKSAVLEGNGPQKTVQGTEPDFSSVKLILTYEDNTSDTITVREGLEITDYDVTKIGSYYALISYLGRTYGTIRIDVTGTNSDSSAKTPYDGLETTTDYPEYPNQGAVRIDKKATSEVGEFERTGVTHVELNVAGISTQKAVDVVLVVDVSNSMAWSVENSGNSSDEDRVPTGNQVSKIEQTMESCKDFAEILMAPNKDGTTNDNTITFVTFGGFDDKHEATNTEYFDSTNTWMLGEKNLDNINAMFDSVSIERNSSYNGGYRISIDGVTGGNFGNTVYDYGFAETMDAISRLQGNSYDTNKRETHVVFMTDGAPSNYNGGYYTTGRAENHKVDANEVFDNNDTMGNKDVNKWYNYICSQEHTYARQVYDKVNGKFSTVGFDLAHGGFSSMQWTEDQLSAFLEKIVRDDKGNGLNPVVAATDEAELAQFYKEAAEAIKAAGSQGRVTDIIDEEFTLQLASATGLTTSEPQTLKTPPKITVTKYDLWTAKDTDDLSLIGTRKVDENGNYIKDVLETVTFNAEGTEAYSNRVEHGNKNILVTATDGTVTINAQTFTYTKTPDGVETFDWFIETISEKEVVLEFDAYLKGSMEGEAPKGTYYTNEEATLEYIDVNGKYVNRLFPVPVVNWGGATTTVRYYLVNEKGQPVNRAGQVVPDAARIYVGNPVTVPLNLNADLSINSAPIDATANVPEGYFLYDNKASFAVKTTSSTEGITGGIEVSDPSPDAFKTTGSGENAKTQTGAQTTIVIDYEPGYYTYSTVGFGVRWDLTQEKISPLENDKIVIDYGKAIQKDVLVNDAEEISIIEAERKATYNTELVGFASYAPNTKLDIIQMSAGNPSLTANNGKFEIVNGKVQYQLTEMLSEVEKVFCVVKFTNKANNTDFFYMYEQLDIIPATTMYYETDFANDVFTNTTTGDVWTTATAGPAADGPQDDGTVGTVQNTSGGTKVSDEQTYGFDSTYENDSALSNASSMFVNGAGVKKTTSKFTFTGTDFDLISRTGAAQGAIRVDIYSDPDRTNKVKGVTVLNKSESGLELYQIPVVSVNDLPYGTYYVTVGVNAAYTNTEYPELNRGGEFYFDAIRIFNPAKGNTEAESAYKADKEFNTELFEVRQQLLSVENYGETSETTVKGVTFVDSTYTNGNPDHLTGNVSVGEYASIGPNNEVYLAPGQGISFAIDYDGTAPASVDIGAKTITGETAHMKAYVSTSATQPNRAVVDKNITSSTAQFQQLVNKDNAADFANAGTAYVFVANTGADVLSITDVKVAYGSDVAAASEVSFVSNARTMAFAEVSMAAAYKVVEDAEVKSVTTDKAAYVPGETVKVTVKTNDAAEYVKVNGKKITSFKKSGSLRIWTYTEKASKTGTVTFKAVAYNSLDEASKEASKNVTVKNFAPKTLKLALSKSTVVKKDTFKATVTTSEDVNFVKVNGYKVKTYKSDKTKKTRTWTISLKANVLGKRTIKAVAYDKYGNASKTVSKTLTVKKFVPKTFKLALSNSSVKKGTKYVVTVTTSKDVKYVTLNGKKITRFTTDKKSGLRTFEEKYSATSVGKKTVKAVAYNTNGSESSAKTKTVTVKKK